MSGEIVACIVLLIMVIVCCIYAVKDRPTVYRDDRTGRYIIPRSKTTRDGVRRHHD